MKASRGDLGGNNPDKFGRTLALPVKMTLGERVAANVSATNLVVRLGNGGDTAGAVDKSKLAIHIASVLDIDVVYAAHFNLEGTPEGHGMTRWQGLSVAQGKHCRRCGKEGRISARSHDGESLSRLFCLSCH
jgi:hypothetical protein